MSVQNTRAKHQLSTDASGEAPVDKSTSQSMQCSAKQSREKQSKTQDNRACDRNNAMRCRNACPSKTLKTPLKSLSTAASREAPVEVARPRPNAQAKERKDQGQGRSRMNYTSRAASLSSSSHAAPVLIIFLFLLRSQLLRPSYTNSVTL